MAHGSSRVLARAQNAQNFWDPNRFVLGSVLGSKPRVHRQPPVSPPVKNGFRDQHQILLGSDLRLAKALLLLHTPFPSFQVQSSILSYSK